MNRDTIGIFISGMIFAYLTIDWFAPIIVAIGELIP